MQASLQVSLIILVDYLFYGNNSNTIVDIWILVEASKIELKIKCLYKLYDYTIENMRLRYNYNYINFYIMKESFLVYKFLAKTFFL